jgi:hypothetical protein
VFQHLHVTENVHALPEAIVTVHAKLTVPRQLLERIALEDASIVVGEIFEEEPPIEDKEAAVDVTSV